MSPSAVCHSSWWSCRRRSSRSMPSAARLQAGQVRGRRQPERLGHSQRQLPLRRLARRRRSAAAPDRRTTARRSRRRGPPGAAAPPGTHPAFAAARRASDRAAAPGCARPAGCRWCAGRPARRRRGRCGPGCWPRGSSRRPGGRRWWRSSRRPRPRAGRRCRRTSSRWANPPEKHWDIRVTTRTPAGSRASSARQLAHGQRLAPAPQGDVVQPGVARVVLAVVGDVHQQGVAGAQPGAGGLEEAGHRGAGRGPHRHRLAARGGDGGVLVGDGLGQRALERRSRPAARTPRGRSGGRRRRRAGFGPSLAMTVRRSASRPRPSSRVVISCTCSRCDLKFSSGLPPPLSTSTCRRRVAGARGVRPAGWPAGRRRARQSPATLRRITAGT